MNERAQMVLNAATRKQGGNKIPIYFNFADKTVEQQYAETYGMDRKEFYQWLASDIKEIFTLEDIQMRFSDETWIKESYQFGLARKSKSMEHAAYDDWGCAWTDNAIGQELRLSPIKDIEEVYDYPFPNPDNPDIFHDMQEKVDTFHKDGYATFIAQFYTMFERAWAMTGYTDFLCYCYEEPEAVEYLLDKITDNKLRMAEKICSYHPTLGHTADDFGLQVGGVMSQEMFRKFFKPRYEKIWAVYRKHGIPVMHHSCGDCSSYLGDMIDAGLDMLHTVQQTAMDIKMIGREFGNDLSFFASIDTVDILTNGTPDDVRRNVDDTVKYLGKNNGLLLAAINIMPNAPVDNVHAAIAQMKQYRK